MSHSGSLHPKPTVSWSSSIARVLPGLNEHTQGVVVFDAGQGNVVHLVSKLRVATRYLSLPIIVVTNRSMKDVQARLIAIGASAVFGHDCTDAQILAEVGSQCNTQPVLEEIRARLLNPFTLATTVTFQEMANTEVKVKSIYQKVNHNMFGDISAVIGLVNKTSGAMVLSFPEACASSLTKRVLADVVDEPNGDIVRDCIGEIANVITGQARGILAQTPFCFEMSTPAIVSGTMHSIWYRPSMPCLVTVFECDIGEFALQLCLNFDSVERK